MNHHPYGGYDQGPPDRGNRAANEAGYGNEGPGRGYYPSPAPAQPHMQSQAPPPQHYPPPNSMNSHNDYHNGPNRNYREGGAYPPPQDYRPGPPQGMGPPGSNDGRLGPTPGITLGSGPLNNHSQYGGPIRYDGGSSGGGQSPAAPMNGHNPYGSAPDPHRYTADNAANPSRPYPPQMRQQSSGYDMNLPAKPDPLYGSMPPRASLGSPPSHLPRPPGREWNDDQPTKRPRRDGGSMEDEKDDVIKERLKRERPCRTLFVRNIEFNADIDDLRRRFEAFGEIKSWFDLTSKRGLLFISYYDLRCAEYAKAAMQEFVVNGRKVDVHYSLPREVDMTKRCDRDKDQGTLFILLKRAQGELNDEEVRATFAQYGEIKSLRRYKDQGNCRFLEYFDCRACKAAHDAMFGATWNGGTWDIKYAWDAAAPDRISEKPKRDRDPMRPDQRTPDYGAGFGHDAGGPPPPSPTPGGPPRWGGDQSYGPPSQPGPGYPQQYGPPAGSGYRPPPPPGPPRPPPPQPPSQGGSYGTKRPFDYDDRAGPEPPMRRWGQPQGSANPSPGQYGPPRPEPQNTGVYNRPPAYGGPEQDYGRYGGDRNEYGAPPPPAAGPPPNRWGAPAAAPPPPSAVGYGPPAHQHGGGQSRPPPPAMGPQRPPPPPPAQQHQQHGAPSAPANDDRLEQAQKVQQLLASLKPGNVAAAAPTKAPAAASPAPAAATPSLPSNIAALLQMAQNNAAKK